jgi:CAAD domains of cyanobacterial aminoacyl-tRNA synthetase
MYPEMENNVSEYNPTEYNPPEVATDELPPLPVELMDSSTGSLSKHSPSLPPMSDQDWQQVAQEKLYWLLTEFPERFNTLFGEYKKPISTLAIVLAAIPFVALSLALLEVINAIPLFAPTLELIGFGYASWFVYRYLLFADRRQEFSQNLQDYRAQILGQQDQRQE